MKPPAPRSTRSLIDDQIRRWEHQQQERTAAGPAQEEHWPVITISREFGSLGAHVGQLAAEQLDFTFWDQELVTTIAAQTGAQETLLASLDERTRTKVDEFVANIVVGAGGTAAEYVREVARVVRTLDRQGGAVVVGRGAQFILGPQRALRVRVVCPRQLRVKGYGEREGLSAREAERTVDDLERQRHEFIRRHYQQDIADPSNYDVAISTGALSHDAAAHIVVASYRAKFGRLPPRRA
ncbi:MAG: cytidylate kinase-like family protein [Deltaproteobacteria bacterium]|jgi:cytidylate kinase|nr:cytidylate kinase-like family protein [Deltaproteobacteria bacterium]MBW2530864.1 cytidylate kinase-like family protein [Deltaproteobacteria bacterium]